MLLTVIYFSMQDTLAQKRVEVPLYRHGDTSLAYTWARRDSKKVGLLDLTTTNQTLHFRFWITNQAVDIWTTDGQRFEGILISYTKLQDPSDNIQSDQPEKFYHDSKKIDPIIAKQIYESALSQLIFAIPDQDSIKGWSLGSDGYSVSIEYATPSRYSFKHYWGPHYQRSLREAQIIDLFYQYLESTLNMGETWEKFINRLPKGCYTTGTLSLSCNERKRRKK
jgi:hypothetical protein